MQSFIMNRVQQLVDSDCVSTALPILAECMYAVQYDSTIRKELDDIQQKEGERIPIANINMPENKIAPQSYEYDVGAGGFVPIGTWKCAECHKPITAKPRHNDLACSVCMDAWTTNI